MKTVEIGQRQEQQLHLLAQFLKRSEDAVIFFLIEKAHRQAVRHIQFLSDASVIDPLGKPISLNGSKMTIPDLPGLLTEHRLRTSA